MSFGFEKKYFSDYDHVSHGIYDIEWLNEVTPNVRPLAIYAFYLR